MPNLLNQSKHDESEPRLALQIRNQEQKRSIRGVGRRTEQGFSHQDANFGTSAKLMRAKFSLSPFCCLFDFVFSFSHFYPPCLMPF